MRHWSIVMILKLGIYHTNRNFQRSMPSVQQNQIDAADFVYEAVKHHEWAPQSQKTS